MKDQYTSQRTPSTPTTASQDTVPSLRILVAEDDPVGQELISLMMVQFGHEAKVVGNGKKAVEAMEVAHYDVLLVDLHMPVMDGLTAAKTIRSTLPAEKQPIIIALTADVLPGTRLQCEEAGIDDVITKPYRLKTLQEKLATIAAASR